jgi:hypothetical protein
MFEIAFIDDVPEYRDDGWRGLWGGVTFGAFQERFVAPVERWTRVDYERQWLEAARRLLGEADRTGFVTAPYRFWWTAWREGERVFIHQEFFVPGRYAEPYDGRTPYEIIGARRTQSEDGRVSEWEVTLGDIRDFVARREAPPVPA